MDFLYGVLVGAVLMLVAVRLLGWGSKRKEKPKPETRKYHEEVEPAPATFDNETIFVDDVTATDWYNVCMLVLEPDEKGAGFTMERAAGKEIGRDKWQRIKAVWLRNGYFVLNGRQVSPAKGMVEKIKALRVQSIRKMRTETMRKQRLYPPEQLDSSWHPIRTHNWKEANK